MLKHFKNNWKLKLDNRRKHLAEKKEKKKKTEHDRYVIYPMVFTAKAHSFGSLNHRHLLILRLSEKNRTESIYYITGYNPGFPG